MTARATILYCSVHGTTRKVVRRAIERFSFSHSIVNVAEADAAALDGSEPLVVFCPTYGDEELPEPMERLVIAGGPPLSGRGFAICELGNYYGYDKFDFGALPILDAVFRARGGRRIAAGLSLDSLPRIDWPSLLRWCALVDRGVTDFCSATDAPASPLR